MGIFPSQSVVLLDALESRRLIERRNKPGDRRSHQLSLTRIGRDALNEIGRLTLQLEDDLFAALSDREKDTLEKLLQRIVARQGLTAGVHPAYSQIVSRKKITQE